MADRKAELEAKRERLRQMREEKERRKREKERLDAENAAKSLGGASHSSGGGPSAETAPRSHGVDNSEIDRVLADYGIATVSKVRHVNFFLFL